MRGKWPATTIPTTQSRPPLPRGAVDQDDELVSALTVPVDGHRISGLCDTGAGRHGHPLPDCRTQGHRALPALPSA